jgi:hypothetical protein
MIPFAFSAMAAYLVWNTVEGIALLWKMILIAIVWIMAFAAGTQFFWKAVELLAKKRP